MKKEERERAQEAFDLALAQVDTIDWTTERADGVVFKVSSDGVWYFRVHTRKVYGREGLRVDDAKEATARKEHAIAAVTAAWGERVNRHARGLKD